MRKPALNHHPMIRAWLLFLSFSLLPLASMATSMTGPLAASNSKLHVNGVGGLISGSPEEALLLGGIEALDQNRLGDAINLLEDLVKRRPDFQLAQLVYAD